MVIVQLNSIYDQCPQVIDGAAALGAIEDANGIVVQIAVGNREAATRSGV